MGVRDLAVSIKYAVGRRIAEEARAKRGTIQGDVFVSGSRSYPYKQAVDCNTSNGNRVWAQLSTNGVAVIVGT